MRGVIFDILIVSMGKLFEHPSVLALATLIGTIIGAGIFGLPYAVHQSGVVVGVLYFLGLGGVVLLLHLFFGEFALRTEEKHRLPGYAEVYLGRTGKYLAVLAIAFSIGGALLAYIIIGGEFLAQLTGEWIDVPLPLMSFAFWAIMSFFIFRGIRSIAAAELIMVLSLFFIIGVVVFFAWPHIEVANFSLTGEGGVFWPYGVVLFALTGWSAIPEIAELLKTKKEKGRLDNIIVYGSVLTVLLYLAFTFAILGVAGSRVSEDALIGLEPFLGSGVVALGVFFGFLAVAASFLVLGNYMKNSLRYDFGLPYYPSAILATFIPLALYFLGFRSFLAVIDIVGALALGAIEGVLIVLIYRQAKIHGDRTPEYRLSIPDLVLWFIIALLVSGAVVKVFFGLIG